MCGWCFNDDQNCQSTREWDPQEQQGLVPDNFEDSFL